jgi:CheY-like chemotaxis protein
MELKNATVLVVDDESMLLDIFREWLEEEHCSVLTARDGAGALQILRNQHVDVLVSDVRMPVMDGILLLKNLRTYVGTSQKISLPKMIFISGFTDLEPREAYDLGVEVIMQKPMKRDQFVDAVRQTLRSREEMWAVPSSPGGLQLHLALPRVSAAIEQGRIAFGRGGFCVRCIAPNHEGAVRFDLEFEGEKVSFAGHGLICWADPEEGLLGVEISDLDEACRAWAIDLINANASSSHIPRAPLSGQKAGDKSNHPGSPFGR